MKKLINPIFSALLLTLIISCSESGRKNTSKKKTESLSDQRKSFKTTLIPNSYVSDGETPIPPDSLFQIIQYQTEVGALDAYLSTNINTTKKLPAVIWAHGGFGGIGSWLWEYGSYIESYTKSDIVILCPSWRGENNNPGKFELFYGEVNDLKSAIDYLSSLKYVDTSRIYLAGHSTGGTLTMLASMMSNKIRATFTFGGAPDIHAIVDNGTGYGNTPYDNTVVYESELRSATKFVDDIKNPIFYFEGEDSFYPPYALEMEKKAKLKNIPFYVNIIPGGTHFNIVNPINELIIEKINTDTSSKINFTFNLEEILSKMN